MGAPKNKKLSQFGSLHAHVHFVTKCELHFTKIYIRKCKSACNDPNRDNFLFVGAPIGVPSGFGRGLIARRNPVQTPMGSRLTRLERGPLPTARPSHICISRSLATFVLEPPCSSTNSPACALNAISIISPFAQNDEKRTLLSFIAS